SILRPLPPPSLSPYTTLFRSRPFDGAQIPFLFRRDEGERRAGHLGAGGAADAMDVVLRLRRHVEVDDMPERRDVDAARGDVGREDRKSTRLNSSHDQISYAVF